MESPIRREVMRLKSAPQPGGFILLWRSLMENGHLHMPATAFKIFIFLLLKVNSKPGAGCERGEGWITYDMIREKCSEEGKGPMPNSTISRALEYLERKGYIERIQERKGGPQKIRVKKYEVYQDLYRFDTSIDSIQPAIQVAIPKQQVLEEEADKEAKSVRELPDHLRDDWMKAFEFWYLDAPPPTYIQRFARFQHEGGLTDRLIVAVLEKGRQLKKRNVCAWASPILAELASYGIRTVEEWEQFERERNAKSASKRSKPSPVVPEDEVTKQLQEMLRRGNQIQ